MWRSWALSDFRAFGLYVDLYCTVLFYGKLSDIYGRRIIYAVAMVMFLIGWFSVACPEHGAIDLFSCSFQGVGAGGVCRLPLSSSATSSPLNNEPQQAKAIKPGLTI